MGDLTYIEVNILNSALIHRKQDFHLSYWYVLNGYFLCLSWCYHLSFDGFSNVLINCVTLKNYLKYPYKFPFPHKALENSLSEKQFQNLKALGKKKKKKKTWKLFQSICLFVLVVLQRKTHKIFLKI